MAAGISDADAQAIAVNDATAMQGIQYLLFL
jgi:hypothetical protein